MAILDDDWLAVSAAGKLLIVNTNEVWLLNKYVIKFG